MLHGFLIQTQWNGALWDSQLLISPMAEVCNLCSINKICEGQICKSLRAILTNAIWALKDGNILENITLPVYWCNWEEFLQKRLCKSKWLTGCGRSDLFHEMYFLVFWCWSQQKNRILRKYYQTFKLTIFCLFFEVIRKDCQKFECHKMMNLSSMAFCSIVQDC